MYRIVESVSKMIDRYGRAIDYLRISLTDKCNLRCVYCMPAEKRFRPGYVNDVMKPEDFKFLIKGFADNGIKKIRFTGGEPLLYPQLPEIIKFTRECGVKDIAITTNGIGLVDKIKTLKECGLTAVNISMDSLKQYKYRAVTRNGNLNEVINAINACSAIGLKVKINCVAIKDFNDNEIVDFIEISRRAYVDVRFIELMPIGEAKQIYQRGYLDIRNVIESLPEIRKVKERQHGSIADYYVLPGSKGRVGVITPLSCSFCDRCNRVRITADGMLKLCLHSKNEIDLKPLLHKQYLFNESIKEYIWVKPRRHNLVKRKSSDSSRDMYQIGG